MSFDLFPPLGDIAAKPFRADPRTIDRLALAMSAYTMAVLYPAYGLMRWWWTGTTSAFSPGGIAVAVLVAGLFGLFARRTMRQYAFIGKRR